MTFFAHCYLKIMLFVVLLFSCKLVASLIMRCKCGLVCFRLGSSLANVVSGHCRKHTWSLRQLQLVIHLLSSLNWSLQILSFSVIKKIVTADLVLASKLTYINPKITWLPSGKVVSAHTVAVILLQNNNSCGESWDSFCGKSWVPV